MLFQTTSTETSIQFEPFVHRFKPFEPKKGMSLAPVIRKQLSVETKRLLDEGLQHQVRGSCQNSSINQLYLQQIQVESARYQLNYFTVDCVALSLINPQIIDCKNVTA